MPSFKGYNACCAEIGKGKRKTAVSAKIQARKDKG
jgi:hypothetical protein